jgi:hypothetical protein
MDIMVFYFSQTAVRNAAISQKELVKEKFIEISKNNPSFVSSLETTTKSLGATLARFRVWTEALNDVLHLDLSIPELQNNRIQF